MKHAFKIWLAIMVPAIIVLTIVGYTCDSCVLPLAAPTPAATSE